MAEDATGKGPDAEANSQTAPEANAPTTQSATYDEAAVTSKVSAAVNEALKAERAKQAALLEDKTKDSDAKLAELTAQAEKAQRYADFTESAVGAGIRNVKAAYHVAMGGDYLDKRGKFDLDGFRKDNPEFFAAAPNANAGAGAGSTSDTNDMNAQIRRVAGVA